LTILDRFNRDGIEPTLHNFCARIEDALADAGHSHKVRWGGSTLGCINILIGNVECYSLIPNNNSWIVTYHQ
jgi:hypothetical protein